VAQKRARKRKSAQYINDSAEGVIGLSPLVEASTEDLGDALWATSRQVVRHPIVAAKHSLGLAGRWLDVGYGKSDYQPGKRDRRFADESWQDNGLFNRLLQGYLALDESLARLLSIHPAVGRRHSLYSQ
jgi:poly[(R)-3-hydroxyalkanoate] polymerase subunit PhaC